MKKIEKREKEAVLQREEPALLEQQNLNVLLEQANDETIRSNPA